MGVAQLVFALVGPSYQAAPGGVQLGALLLDVVHCLWVGLDQTLRCLPKRVHLGRGMGGGGEQKGKCLKKKKKTKESGKREESHLHSDLIAQSCQVSLKPFMFALQSLDTGQVVAVVVGVEGLVFLLNPLFSLIGIPEEAQTENLGQRRCAIGCQRRDQRKEELADK